MEDQHPTEQAEMSFIDHLEELRWHMIRGIAAIIICSIGAFVFITPIFDHIILAPTRENFATYSLFCDLSKFLGLGKALCLKTTTLNFQVLDITAEFMISLKAAVTIGFITAFPYVAWESWRFLEPALLDNEKKHATGIVFFVSLLFFIGVAFGYFVLTPFSVNFFANYKLSDMIVNQFRITSYISLLTTIVMAAGIMFQLPIAVYILSKIGLLTPQFMRANRRYAFVVILVIAAIITPADVWTQILVTIPVYFLYEFSVLICARIYKQEQAKAKQAEAELQQMEANNPNQENT